MAQKSRHYDVAIVGGGVFGLWIARQCAAAGLTACLVDKSMPGAGASGGLLGALMPHMPDRWDAKKQFQFEALCTLPAMTEQIESETGLSTGYRRTGRVMPIRTRDFLRQVPERQDGSAIYWENSGLDLTFDLIEEEDRSGWLARGAAPLGYTFENLSARISPRAYLAALAASVAKTCTILEGFSVASIDGERGILQSAPGSVCDTVEADTIVLTAGYESFSFLQSMTGLSLGKGIKGQALLLDTREDPAHPIVYDDGTYIIVHDDGRTAVGSTSQGEWDHPTSTDPDKAEFLKKAYGLVPRLRDAPVLEWWAGVRPRCHLRDPIVGYLSENPRVIAATGGFKISFGIAHKIADAVVSLLTGKDPYMPDTFAVEHHIRKARTKLENAERAVRPSKTEPPRQ